MSSLGHRTFRAAIAGFALFGVAFVLGIGVVGFAPAAHADAGGLHLTVEAGDPARPVLVLTNQGAAACQVVAGALGTVSYTAVEQGGAPVEPISAEGSLGEGMAYILAGQLHMLAPGESVRVALPMIEWGPTGHALQSVAWSPAAGTYAQFYPIHVDQPLTVHATYAIPVVSGTTLCTSAVVSDVKPPAAAPARSSRSVLLWVIGGIGLLLLVCLVTALAVRRRRRRAVRAGSTVVVLIVVASVFAQAWQAPPAYATIVPSAGLASAWAGCSQLLHEPGHDPANILPTLEDPNIKVEITPGAPNGTDYGNAEYGISKTHMLVTWNINDFHQYAGTGGTADPCDSLYHELYHAFEHAKGTYDHNTCITAADGDTHIPIAEVNATRAQNKLRAKLHRDERSHYGQLKMPTGDCLPPPPPDTCHDPAFDKTTKNPAPIVPPARSTPVRDRVTRLGLLAGGRDGCGDSNGDPHLRTFDGRRYDFQAAGEFVLARDPADGFQVQVRQQPFPGSRWVAVNTAVAMAVGSDRVEAQLTSASTLRLLVNGTARTVAATSLPDGGSLAVTPRGGLVVIWPDNSRVTVTAIGRWGLRVAPEPSAHHDGKLEGLLGDLDGSPANDIKTRGGATVTNPGYDTLYPGFADSWRIDAKTTLFTYDPGTSTASFTDRTFPDRPPSGPLPNQSAAEAICRSLGVSDPEVFSACVLDVALTGQPDFAVAAAAGQVFSAGAAAGAIQWTATISAPGQTATLTVDATAGQKLYVDVVSSTLPDQCGVVQLRAPDGSSVGSGCIISGKGFVEATVLAAAGTYRLTVDPNGAATGLAHLSLIFSQDNQGTTSIDGPEVVATQDKAGQVTRLTFSGVADQKVFIDMVSSTLPDTCGVVRLSAPDRTTLNTGCVITGKGYVDATYLPVTGTYTVTVDPSTHDTGQTRLRLTSATDQHGTIAINGASVTAQVQQAGAIAAFTFTGTAGQKVVVEVLSSTLPDQCGVVLLRAPDGTPLGSTCVISGKGTSAATALPATGTYTLTVDPSERATGQTTLRLHT